MDMIFQIIKKYEDIVLYGFFGVCTTIINLISYFFFYNILKFSNVASTCIAWTIAVAFAYITNKIFVFKSKSFNFDILVKEILSFFGCRFLTGILDVVIMFFSVDVYCQNSTLWKVISNILVIVLNFLLGKLVVFKK